MQPVKIDIIYDSSPENHKVFLFTDSTQISDFEISELEKDYLLKSFSGDSTNFIHFFREGLHHFYFYVPKGDDSSKGREALRLAGAKLNPNTYEIETLIIIDKTDFKGSLFFTEGLILASYSYDKFISKKKKEFTKYIFIDNIDIDAREIDLLNISNLAVFFNRNMTNEPQLTFNTAELVEALKKMTADFGISLEVYNRRKIESLKMGGLLAVNQGSFSDPAFAILRWNPQDAVNEKPIVLVGKGVMFDTGGLNIKTGNFMNDMHMDMAGAASVISAIYASALSKLPVNIIGLLPITDNRPGNNAFAPGDIIKMHNGKTVEIANTDAEGRLILADALSYAQKLKPELVIDLATLTGSAARAIGKYAAPAMHNDPCPHFELLKSSGDDVYERIVEFPLWEEYAETIKSDFADLKNLGGVDAGAITAAKFLENFVDYPWIHIDIAGPAILSSNYGYQTKGASGFGSRLLYKFLLNFINTQS